MSVNEIIVIGILIIWFAACLSYSIFNSEMAKFTLKWDIFKYISTYNLFSGTPGNYRLFYRDKHSNQTESEWYQIQLLPQYKWYHALWFPGSSVSVSIRSAIDDLISLEKKYRQTSTNNSLSERFIFRLIQIYVNRFPLNQHSEARQFKIEEAAGFTENQETLFVYISDFYKL